MMNTVCAVVHDGRIELLEQTSLPEGARVLVTLVSDDDERLWLGVSRASLDAIWDNHEGVHAE